jgi:hypothetical protein
VLAAPKANEKRAAAILEWRSACHAVAFAKAGATAKAHVIDSSFATFCFDHG